MSILLLSKTTESCKAAHRFLRTHGTDVTLLEGERGMPLPDAARAWQGDYIVSFLSPWIVPEAVLLRARKAAINFHPAPPEYPGIGCYNFALYDGVTQYGVTCHHMVAHVDSGTIVRVVRFPVFVTDTVESLKERSMAILLTLFHDILSLIITQTPLPTSDDTWKRRPYTRQELDALCRITPEMSADEIRRRVRATFYPPYPGPFIELAGYRFNL